VGLAFGCTLPAQAAPSAEELAKLAQNLNYNFAGGLYLTTSPIVTANWEADSSQRWTVPLGGGIGKIFHLGKLPVNTQIGAYYNVVHPDNGPDWQVRLQVQLMFPK
jgi:hypothetical protein